LCDRIAASDLVYAHIWRPGDTLVWNNLMVQHARRDFPSDQARTLRRLTVGRGPVQ
jgi:alpha-ketoglutarate-dependent taurine dioxygenase